jgi:hypothetical protein
MMMLGGATGTRTVAMSGVCAATDVPAAAATNALNKIRMMQSRTRRECLQWVESGRSANVRYGWKSDIRASI